MWGKIGKLTNNIPNSKIVYKVDEGKREQVIIKGSGKYIIELVGEGASVEILGVLLASDGEELTVEVTTIHKAASTNADIFIRAVVDGRAKVLIKGMIKVVKGAQKTNAFLRENALLLDEQARAEVIPNLEIEADDVKVSHAATVGRVNDEQLFYLMSRGLSRVDAKEMIVEGFLKAVYERMEKKT